jgi:hypothetical protein
MRHLSTILIFSILASTIIATVLGATGANALSVDVIRHDTDLQSTYQHLKVCSCGGQVDVVRVKNVGDLTATYTFELGGDANWFTLDRTYATLRPEEFVDVTIFTSAPCASTGTYRYTLSVASEYGRYRAVDRSITTGICESISATLAPANRTVEPCGEGVFTLTLQNVATFTEDYTITSEEDALDFPARVTLEAGERVELDGRYRATCEEWGEQTVPVTITSERNALSVTRTATVTVPRSYDYGLSIGDVPQPVCAGVTTMVPVTVRNVENRANTITLTTLTATSDETHENLTVRAERTATTTLPFTPARAGERVFSVRATGQNGSIEKEASVAVPVEACYGLVLDAPRSVQACTGTVQIPFTITSEGTRNQDVALEIRSNTTTYIDALREELRAGETISKTVTALLPDADRLWYVTLVANGTYASDERTVALRGFSTESCYALTPTEHRFRVWTDQETLPVIIRHTGIEPETYTVSYEGSFLTPIERTLTLGPDDTVVLHFTINASGYEPGRYVDRLTLSTRGVDYTTDFAITLREKGFWNHVADACRADNGFAVCSVTSLFALAVLVGIIIVAAGIASGIWRYHRPASRSRETWTIAGGIVLIALLVTMLLTAPTIPRTYERPVGPSSPADYHWEIGEGQSVTLDLAAHFVDPDADPLTLVPSPTDKLAVSVQGTRATITADTGWSGIEHLVFTAADGRGGFADSDVFTITVVPYRPVGVLEFWQRACWFLTALFLFLAVTVVLLVALLSPLDGADSVSRDARDDRGRNGVVPYGDPDEIGLEVDSDGRALTPLERDVVEQAKQLVHAEQAIVAQNMVINQGSKEEGLWVASKDGNRFHSIHSPYVKRIPKEKRIIFSTKEEAIKAGYTPAKMDSTKP